MLLVLALGIFVLREGLRIRRGRLTRRGVGSATHRRYARVFVAAALLGYGSGLFSMAVLRGESLAESVHFPLVSFGIAALALAGVLGLLLERGAGLRARTAHALAGALGLLSALGGAAAGMAILP